MKAVSNIRFKWYESYASGMSHARGFQCKRCEMYCKPYEGYASGISHASDVMRTVAYTT